MIQQVKGKEPIPQFKNHEEEAKFWDTHDVADYWHDFEPVDIDFQLEKPKEDNIVVRLRLIKHLQTADGIRLIRNRYSSSTTTLVVEPTTS